MKKITVAFGLGILAACTFPLTRAFMQGVADGVAEERAKATVPNILDYSNLK